MGWLKRDAPRHPCDVPRVEPRAVWQCDECGRIYTAVLGSPCYDFINDRPWPFAWYWRSVDQ